MEKNLKNSAQRIQDILHDHNLDINVVEFKKLTRTAQEAAEAIGCEVGQIAKTLIFKGKQSAKPVVVIASGINRVDEKKIAAIIGEKIVKPDADFVLKNTTFVIGGVPPIGYTLDIKPVIDEDLVQHAEIWAAAGTPNAVFAITPKDLVRITQGTISSVKK